MGARLAVTRRQHPGRGGFTLIELIIVVVLVGIGSAIALPKFWEYRRAWALESGGQQIVGDLQRARIEAIKRNQTVFLKKSGPAGYTIRFLGNRTLPEGTTFGVGTPDSVAFAPFGPTLTGPATYRIEFGTDYVLVKLSAAGAANLVRP